LSGVRSITLEALVPVRRMAAIKESENNMVVWKELALTWSFGNHYDWSSRARSIEVEWSATATCSVLTTTTNYVWVCSDLHTVVYPPVI
jgi:hypothetical protein